MEMLQLETQEVEVEVDQLEVVEEDQGVLSGLQEIQLLWELQRYLLRVETLALEELPVLEVCVELVQLTEVEVVEVVPLVEQRERQTVRLVEALELLQERIAMAVLGVMVVSLCSIRRLQAPLLQHSQVPNSRLQGLLQQKKHNQ
jgi:hypothetical protein